LPGFGVQIAATHPFIFCTLAVHGSMAAVVAAIAGILGAIAGNAKQRDPIRVSFNLGAATITTSLTAWVFHALGGITGASPMTLVAPLLAATAVYFFANSGLVTSAIVLEKRTPFFKTWTETFRWTTVTYLAGTTLAVLMISLLDAFGLWGMGLAIPPVWMIVAFYRANKEKLEEHQRRVHEVETLNAELEQRVEERTHDVKEALAQIKELQKLKATLTQTLVHDLKNPLSAVSGNLDLLEMQSQDEKVLRLVRRSRAGSDRLMRMIMDLMDIARMEEGRFELAKRPVDPAALAAKAIDHAEASYQQQQVTLELVRPDEPCRVRADSSVLERVYDNLLANALRYSPKRGMVTIAVRPLDDAIEITVADQGTGIPEEFRAKVFEKYAQVELREAGLSVNRGLGLTFCSLAIEAHGGTIVADEAPDGGAMFRIRLPLEVVSESDPIEVPAVPVEERDAPVPVLTHGD